MSRQLNVRNGLNAPVSSLHSLRRAGTSTQIRSFQNPAPQIPTANSQAGASAIQGPLKRSRTKSETTTPKKHVFSIPDVIPSLVNILTNFEDVEDIVNDDKTIDYSRALAMVMVRSQGSLFTYQSNARIMAVNSYEARLASGCYEGRRAQQHGSYHVDPKFATPGIPTRKFNDDDLVLHGSHVADWSIQDVMRDPTDPSKCMVLYLGWTSKSIEEKLVREIENSSEDVVRNATTRDVFLKKLAAINRSVKPWVQRELFPDWRVCENEAHRLWLYKDLSYYHTELHADLGMGPVHYFCLQKTQLPPPKFAYTCVNIFHEDAYQRCQASEAAKSFGDLKKIGDVKAGKVPGACEKVASCKCNERAATVYWANDHASNGITLLHHDANGLLNVDKFEYEKANIAMECSDECQCNPETCPRRVLQRGKSPALAVVYIKGLGFCVVAMEPIKKGGFISEYVGEMLYLKSARYRAQKLKSNKRVKKADWTGTPVGFRIPDEMKADMPDIHHDARDETDDEEDEKLDFLCTGRSDQYEARFGVLDPQLVICAEHVGNVARFHPHSCNANAAFIETHSRRYEADAFCPRMAVYALRDIEIGDVISLRYYAEENMKEVTKTRCKCRKGCPNYMPDIRYPSVQNGQQ